MKRTNSFVLFGRAFKNARNDFWVSIQVLFVLTLLLAILFYFVEHTAQPQEYANFWNAFVWAITRYIGDPGHFAGNGPITLIGRYIDTIIGLLKILVFAVPAGLVANGFRKAMEDEKRKKTLEEYGAKILKSFKRKQDRRTCYRIVPRFVSVADIQVAHKIDTKGILDAVEFNPSFRLRNLASAQNITERPQDRLVIELFPTVKDITYGCKIDRNSKVTIVSTSSSSEAGIGHFAYYLALFGGFNYISKEIEPDPENPVSYYLLDEAHQSESQQAFLTDLQALTEGEDKWALFMLSASGADEPSYPTTFHFIHKVNQRLGTPPTTVLNEEQFQTLYRESSAMLEQEFELTSEQDQCYRPVAEKNIALQIGGGTDRNAFTLRVAYSVTVWDQRHISIARNLSKTIKRILEPNVPLEKDNAWKEAGIGF